MTALVWMRLRGYLRTGRIVAPVLAVLVALGTFYGGGAAQAGDAYGVSALLVFPALAWQTKLLLDAEPDLQRRLARVAVGSAARECAAGLIAAALAAVPLLVLALVLPWPVGGVQGPVKPEDPPLLSGVAAGVWAHLVLVPPAVLLGALASRAVTRTFGIGATVLVGGSVLALVLGLRGSPLWWAAPPLLSMTRLTVRGFVLSGVLSVSVHALLWTVVAALLYARVRRSRA